MLGGGVSPAWAQDVITVYGSSTSKSDIIPTQSYNTNMYQKCEFIIPSELISDINGKSITKLKFYTYTTVASSNLGGATYQVFLKEIGTTNALTAFQGTTGATIVYTGTLSIASNELEIEFSEGYTYTGNNLLVGVYLTTKGNYGSKVEFNCQGGFDNIVAYFGTSSSSLESVSGSAKYFVPRTTFTYETPASCAKPKNFATSDVTDESATLTK